MRQTEPTGSADGELTRCPTCGRALDQRDRHVRYRLPDPVLALPHQEATPGTWMSHDDADSSVMMQVPDVGPFCRSLLPIRLEGGHTVSFGVWIAVHPDDLQRAFRVWWTPQYPEMELDGYLANALPKCGALGSPVRAVVLDPEHTPTIVSSARGDLTEVLQREWPHDDLLPLLPS